MKTTPINNLFVDKIRSQIGSKYTNENVSTMLSVVISICHHISDDFPTVDFHNLMNNLIIYEVKTPGNLPIENLKQFAEIAYSTDLNHNLGLFTNKEKSLICLIIILTSLQQHISHPLLDKLLSLEIN